MTPFNTRAEVVLFFGDKEYLFALKCPQIEELQRLCNASIFTIVRRVFSGDAYLVDLRESVRLGLIGGGLDPVRSAQMISLYFDGVPLDDPNHKSSPYKTAKAVLGAMMVGVDELEGDPDGEPAPKKSPSMNQSTSPPFEQPSSNSTASLN